MIGGKIPFLKDPYLLKYPPPRCWTLPKFEIRPLRGWIIDPPEFICFDFGHAFGPIFEKWSIHCFSKNGPPYLLSIWTKCTWDHIENPLRRWPCAMLTGPSNGRTFPLCSHDIGNSLPQALRGASINSGQGGCDVERGSGCLKTPHSANGPWKKKFQLYSPYWICNPKKFKV